MPLPIQRRHALAANLLRGLPFDAHEDFAPIAPIAPIALLGAVRSAKNARP